MTIGRKAAVVALSLVGLWALAGTVFSIWLTLGSSPNMKTTVSPGGSPIDAVFLLGTVAVASFLGVFCLVLSSRTESRRRELSNVHLESN